MKNQQTGQYEELLNGAIGNTVMRELNVSKSKYQTSSGSLRVNIYNTAQVTLNGRVLGPDPVVCYVTSEASLLIYDLN